MDRNCGNQMPVWVAAIFIAQLIVFGALRLGVEWIHDERIVDWWRWAFMAFVCG